MSGKLGCFAYELEAGVEFSNDEGRSWLTVQTIVEDVVQSSDDILINARNDYGSIETLRIDSMARVLLNRNWKGE
jgi:hypothetical protein